MVFLGHVALSVSLLWVDPRAQKFDISGGVTAEVRGGRAPRMPSPDVTPEPSVLMIVSPNVDFATVSRSRGTFMFGYAPRVQWRLPNRLSVKRPLLLHQGYLTYGVGLSRRWSLGLDVSGSVGELDYMGLQIALGPEQAATPTTDVAQFAVAHAQLDFTAIPDRRSRILFGPRFDLRKPIGDSARMGETTLPQQISGGFLASYVYAVDSLDALDVTVLPGIVNYDEDLSFLNVDARVGWGHQWTALWGTHVDLGVFAAERVRGRAVTDQESTRVFPVGSVDIGGRLWSGARRRYLDGTLRTGVIGFFDRISERVEPRGMIALAITGSLPPRWAIGIRGSFYTAATLEPRPPRLSGYNLLALPETVIQAQTPITYTINHQTRFEFGTVMSVRGSHLASDNFRFSQLETWLYVAIRFAASTSRGRMELGPRSSGAIGAGTAGMGSTYGSP